MAKKEHCSYCFEVLIGHFNKTAVTSPTFENASYPLFVSWHKTSTKNKNESSLRGCKGTFSSLKLFDGLAEFSLNSALQDSRFSPITAQEIPRLECGVSLLTNFEDVKSVWDWEVGKHGIIIDFTDPRGKHRNATYLPEVAPEQNWDKMACVQSLIEKSGYKEKVTQNLLQSISLTRYQSSKEKLHYEEFIEFKQGISSEQEDEK